MTFSRILVGISFLTLLIGVTASAADTTDPRVGKMTYEGSGAAEKAPEFGEVWFTFSVTCRQSADDVRQAIEAVSGKIWNAIATQVPPSATSEKSASKWGNIGDIMELSGSRWLISPPNGYNGPVVPGSAKRIDVCTEKEIKLDAKIPTIFSGTQKFGVRTDKLDWLDSRVKTVQALPQDKATNTVKISTSGVLYNVTEGTKREMLAETLDKARLEATGDGSKYASDKTTLKFSSAHYLGHRVSQPPVYNPVVRNSVARGLAPKVTLETPYVYTIYSEAKDLIPGNTKSEGVKSEYEITGKAVVDADYAQMNASITTHCQATNKAALKATEPYSTDILKDLHDFQGKRPVTESDRLENNEANSPLIEYPYQPVEWDITKANFPTTRYLNTCTNQEVDAPPSGEPSDLPSYWTVTRTLSIRSKDFNGLLTLVEKLQRQYNKASLATDDTKVSVGDVVGQVTDETKRKLAIAARENATAYVLNAHGPLAQDAKAHGFTSAQLVDIKVGTPYTAKLRGGGGEFRAYAAAAPGAALGSANVAGAASPELGVDVVHKPNEERPVFRMSRNYEFDFEFVTQDYLPYLAAPKPTTQPPQARPLSTPPFKVHHIL